VSAVSSGPSRVSLRLSGELDLASARAFTACIEGQVAEGHRHVHLDLSELVFVDATGLSALVQAHQRLLDQRGSLVIDAMSPRCRRLVEMVGLHHTLLISDQADGMTSFSADGRNAMLIGISAK